MSNWQCRVLGGLCGLLLFTVPGYAQQVSQPDKPQQAKNEIESLYSQWRQENPNDPITTNAFWAYLDAHPSSKTLGYNSFLERIEPVAYCLPSGAWLLSAYVPDNGKLLGFYVDLNGPKQPNGNLFGEDSDQFRFEMDNSGQIGQ